jgi:hypothetical protein
MLVPKVLLRLLDEVVFIYAFEQLAARTLESLHRVRRFHEPPYLVVCWASRYHGAHDRNLVLRGVSPQAAEIGVGRSQTPT